VEIVPREMTRRLAPHMHRERRRRMMEKLFGVVVGENDPQIRLQHPQLLADDVTDRLDHLLVLGIRQREELRGMRQQISPTCSKCAVCIAIGVVNGCRPCWRATALACRIAGWTGWFAPLD